MIAERNVTIEECPVQIVECRVLIVGWEQKSWGERKHRSLVKNETAVE